LAQKKKVIAEKTLEREEGGKGRHGPGERG